jgi:ABC-type multidrug transport system permease subunit
MNLRRFLAIVVARNREFYRDRTSLGWNLIFPLLTVLMFAFIFGGGPADQYKVGVLAPGGDLSAARSAFLDTRHVRFIAETDEAAAVTKVRRHQIDMLLDLRGPPRYWVNSESASGYLAERLLVAASAPESTPLPAREAVQGRQIRYVDWVLPGVIATNMMFSCLWGVGYVIVRYRKNGVLRRLQATPLTAFEFLTAQVVSRLLVVSVVTALVYLLTDLMMGFAMFGSYLLLALVFFCGAACLVSMGLLVSVRTRTEELADGLLNLISWPMMIFSGAWFSMEGAHPLAQALAQAFPLTHLVDASRRVMLDGAGLVDVAPELGLLAGTTAVLLAIAARLFRWS